MRKQGQRTNADKTCHISKQDRREHMRTHMASTDGAGAQLQQLLCEWSSARAFS